MRAPNKICPYDRMVWCVRSTRSPRFNVRRTRHTVRCYIITPSSSPIAQFTCVWCSCATQKPTDCSTGISSIKTQYFFFSIFRCAKPFRCQTITTRFSFVCSIVGCDRLLAIQLWWCFFSFSFLSFGKLTPESDLLFFYSVLCVFRAHDYDQSN